MECRELHRLVMFPQKYNFNYLCFHSNSFDNLFQIWESRLFRDWWNWSNRRNITSQTTATQYRWKVLPRYSFYNLYIVYLHECVFFATLICIKLKYLSSISTGKKFHACGSMGNLGTSQHWLHMVPTTIDFLTRAKFSHAIPAVSMPQSPCMPWTGPMSRH